LIFDFSDTARVLNHEVNLPSLLGKPPFHDRDRFRCLWPSGEPPSAVSEQNEVQSPFVPTLRTFPSTPPEVWRAPVILFSCPLKFILEDGDAEIFFP